MAPVEPYVPDQLTWGGVSDSDLWNTQLALALACGRSHSSLKKKHRQWLCDLFRALAAESERRDREPPHPPYVA